VELDLATQLRQLVDQALRPRDGIAVLEVVLTECVVGLAARDDVRAAHEQRLGERHHGLLGPTAGRETVGAGGECRVVGVRGRLRGLNEDGAQTKMVRRQTLPLRVRPLR
jgi:hypothetical protein